MAYREEHKLMNEAQISKELFYDYNGSERSVWAENVREDEEFRHNVQWKEETKQKILSRGNSPIVINHIDYAVEQAKAMMTAQIPRFKALPREDSDVKTAKVAELLLDYTYDISDGRTVISNQIDDFLTKSQGVIVCYYDKYAANGKGRVKFIDTDPLDVFIDPKSKLRDYSDAENIIIARLMSLPQILKLFSSIPDIEKKAKKLILQSAAESHYPYTQLTSSEGQVFPGEIANYDDYIAQVLERYSMKPHKVIRVFERMTNMEKIFFKEEFPEYLQEWFYYFNGQFFPKEAAPQIQQAMQQMTPEQAMQIQIFTAEQLIEMGYIETVQTEVMRCYRYVSIEEELLFQEVMPLDEYPIKFAVNKWNRTPYPESDVRYAKGLNEYINKHNSLIIAYGSATANIKMLVPEGSIDVKQARKEWARPDAFVTYNPEFGQPYAPQMNALSPEFYANQDRWKHQIELQFGLSEFSQGMADGAPQTFRATMMLEEISQRRIAGKLRVIEKCLSDVARVLFKMIQYYYTQEEAIRIIQPSGQMSEVRINYMGFDDYSGEIRKLNDVSLGEYDFKVIAGSSLPSNRWAQFEYYMELYKNNLIDQIEVLKKTELVDVDGVLNRFNYVQQLESQLQQAVAEIKKIQGDLQTAERESLHDKKRVEVEKFKARLAGVEAGVNKSKELFDARLGDALSMSKNEMRGGNKNPNRLGQGEQ